ncbi:MAG: hypothetical protein ACETWK_00380 [Candidatus Aminicenantaceae bacterium]
MKGKLHLTLRERYVLFKGKFRRMYLVYFRPGYVKRSIKRRRGECRRTGACCRLGFDCWFLESNKEDSLCRINGKKSAVCRFFPIDERDLRDRDIIEPRRPCGYYFFDTQE